MHLPDGRRGCVMVILILKNWTFRNMLKAQLEEEGFEVFAIEYSDESAGFREHDGLLLRSGELIVLYLMDGGYAMEKLRAIKKIAGNVPFLILRGTVGISDRTLRDEGFNFILRRPFSIGDIVKEVKNAVDKFPR